ncbi:MAG: hypothetical protein Satyrvirus2_75 [Satyrvirus sp.]|uniref:Ankyrin repeat protein n=1 Tax=Satyrvirus sp. TaxID=2487771 RepID=A0A3G5AEQ0_9VIRU|nr:MAG: hypothetical protein Satyrvirus2_75 [Satyrvirus sp.]
MDESDIEIIESDHFEEILIKKNINEFIKVVQNLKNRDQATLSLVAFYVLSFRETLDMLHILINQFGFVLTDDFLKKYVMLLSRPENKKIIKDMLGIDIWNFADDHALRYIFMIACGQNDIQTISDLINFGFDINGLPYNDKKDLLMDINYKNRYDTLQFIIDNGFDLNFVDDTMLFKYIKNCDFEMLKVLTANGVDFARIHKFDFPKEFNETYNLLVDLNLDPKSISYSFFV